MKTLNIDDLIYNLQRVKDMAKLDYARVDEGRGHTLLEVLDDIDDKMGDFNNGLVILDSFVDGLKSMKIYTQLEPNQQDILMKILTENYLVEPIYSRGTNVMLYITIYQK